MAEIQQFWYKALNGHKPPTGSGLDLNGFVKGLFRGLLRKHDEVLFYSSFSYNLISLLALKFP